VTELRAQRAIGPDTYLRPKPPWSSSFWVDPILRWSSLSASPPSLDWVPALLVPCVDAHPPCAAAAFIGNRYCGDATRTRSRGERDLVMRRPGILSLPCETALRSPRLPRSVAP
jgi:hypothetical protein